MQAMSIQTRGVLPGDARPAPASASSPPTVWGLAPVELHDHFWASRGVAVVRPGTTGELPRHAELYLLVDPTMLALFNLRPLLDRMFWVHPDVLFVRLQVSNKSVGYREAVITDEDGRFRRFERHYGLASEHLARVALTRDRRVAELWWSSSGQRATWRHLRRQTRAVRRETVSVRARCYDANQAEDVAQFMDALIEFWPAPSATVARAAEVAPGVWADTDARVDRAARVIGRAWIGAGRSIEADQTVVGPAVLWDKPEHRPQRGRLVWDAIEPSEWVVPPAPAKLETSGFRRVSQRAFDIVFACVVLLMTLPLYPLIMLAIWLEDGRPFFFAHRRETLGGREFGCLKFRSMRKDADEIKKRIMAENQSDGPQFFIENDPRVTRVGRILRKTNLDEIPQFINVLLGHMAVVGPRPSPRKENQYCPAWREARLSVRPGITGLWQVSRTRQAGLDFQEWIRFDIEYVQNAGWWMDLKIILRTLKMFSGK